jgi:hypothetical protein
MKSDVLHVLKVFCLANVLILQLIFAVLAVELAYAALHVTL